MTAFEPDVAGPQAASAVAPAPADATPAVLDGDQRALLRAVLNCIVPPRGELAGAGDLDVGASIERTLFTSASLRRLFLDGLAELAVAGFLNLSSTDQVGMLERLEQTRPAFFAALVEHTYRGYYTLPVVQAAIGYEGPPQPRGNTLPVFDLELLAKQRQRAPFWRRTD